MAILNQKKILNVIPGITPQLTVHCSQSDEGSTVEFELYAGSVPFEPDGTASVQGIRKDGTGFGPEAVALDGSTATVTLSTAMTGAAGPALCEITITETGGSVSTANFALLVEEAAFPNGPLIENSVDVYQQILQYVQSFPASAAADATVKVAAEAALRQAADQALQASIDAEATARAAAVSAEATARAAADTQLQTEISGLQNAVGGPNVALTAADFTDITKVYVVAGTIPGMTTGDWYYWNGTQWVSGGVYNSTAVQTDPTLSVAGMPADAAACGDLKSALSDISELALIAPKLEIGTIKEEDGSDSNSSTRVRTGYIPLENFLYADTLNGSYKNTCLFYTDSAYIDSIGTGFQYNSRITAQEISTTFPTATRVRFVYTRADDGNITSDDLYAINELIKTREQVGEHISALESTSEKYGQTIEKLSLSAFSRVKTEIGGLASNSGYPVTNTTRVRTTDYIPISEFVQATYINDTYRVFVIAYDSSLVKIGDTSSFAYLTYTNADIVSMFTGVAFVKVLFSKANTSDDVNALDVYNVSKLVDIAYNYYYDFNTYSSAIYENANVEVGGIRSSDGTPTYNDARARTKDFIHIDNFVKASFIYDTYYPMVFAYDSNQTQLTPTGNTGNFINKAYTNTEIRDMFPGVAYVKLCYRKQDANSNFTYSEVLAVSNLITIVSDIPTQIEDINYTKYWNCDIVKSVAHQGWHKQYPNNTIESMKEAAKKGFKYCEMDVHITSDGKYVIHHDDTIYVNTSTHKIVGQSTGTAYAISEHTYSDLSQYTYNNFYHGDCKIPLLFDMLDACKLYGIKPYVELAVYLTDEQIAEIMTYAKSIRIYDDTMWTSGWIHNLSMLGASYTDAKMAYQPADHMPELTDYTDDDGRYHDLYIFAHRGQTVSIRMYLSTFSAEELAEVDTYAKSLSALGFYVTFSTVDTASLFKTYGHLADYILSNEFTVREALQM